MISRNMPRATALEKRRMDLFRVTGCMLTWLKFGKKVPAECHHIVMAGKRYGHWYTIPLSRWYHRGVPELGRTKDDMRAEYGAALTDGRHAFVASHHYTELELWQKWQVAMGFDDSMPKSKIVPRRLGRDQHAASAQTLVEASTGETPVAAVLSPTPGVGDRAGAEPGAAAGDRA